MAIAGLHLTKQKQRALEIIAPRMEKTPDEFVRDAVTQLITQCQTADQRRLLRQARGMWKDRNDLLSSANLRRE
jgi:hypothetical protein